MSDHPPSVVSRLREVLIGKARDIEDTSVFHKIALVPFLAWVGLGSDGLSSSAYGPEEAFKTLGTHTYLAVLLVLATGLTVLIISAAYSKIIEAFPHGGGGYVVASKLLGHRVGVVSGCALLVDYILTITISIAAGGDALFSFLPLHWHGAKLAVEAGLIIILILLNLRGVKESVTVLAPIFVVFVITHVVGILAGIIGHAPELPQTVETVHTGFVGGASSLGIPAMFLLFIHAYSLGGGTYTGIEAVSNGLQIMREPKVQTAKRTMLYMALSLAFTASGLLLCYLLWKVAPAEGKTMNAVFFENLTAAIPLGGTPFVIVALVSEGMLLVVAAQAGFIDGPRVLANMAVDSWMPRRFAALSDRLTTGNGIVLMGVASLLALFYTGGAVNQLVVMYSINVFLTFSLSIFGMLKHIWSERQTRKNAFTDILLFLVGFVMCAVILVITIVEKFLEGGWLTLLVTAALVFVCFWVKRHYVDVARKFRNLHVGFDDLPAPLPAQISAMSGTDFQPHANDRVAVILVGGYGALGLHTLKSIIKTFPGVYRGFVFASVMVIDSGRFKGEDAMEEQKHETQAALDKYVARARALGFPATSRFAVGTEVVQTGFDLCEHIAEEFPDLTYFTGKVIFEREYWFQRLLHNETAFSLQKRIQLGGGTMVILPAKLA